MPDLSDSHYDESIKLSIHTNISRLSSLNVSMLHFKRSENAPICCHGDFITSRMNSFHEDPHRVLLMLCMLT